MTSAIGIANSEMGRWKRCPRQWFVEQYLGFLPANPSPLGARNFGIRVHAALEAWYGPDHFDPLLILDLLYGAALEESPDDEQGLRADHEMSRIMVSGYMEWVEAEGKDAGLFVVETEKQVRVPLPGFDGVDLRGKLDRVVQDADTGWLYFVDDKTSDNFKRDEQLSEDPQMRLYSLIQWLASGQPPPVLGAPVMVRDDVPLVLGGSINTLRKVKRSAKSQPPYYSRADFRHTPEQMAATLVSVQGVVAEIMRARQALDDAYARGGLIEQVNWVQLYLLRPNWILHDCSWSCPHAGGLCQMMNSGTGWAEVLVSSGRYVQGDAYARYETGPLDAIREQLARR